MFPYPPRVGTYFTASDLYAAASFVRCNLVSDTSTSAAIAKAGVDFNTCTLGLRTNRTSCTADHTTTMLAAHARIAEYRTACNACAYPLTPSSSRPDPPKVRFNAAAETAYNNAVDIFVARTFLRCNTAALDSSVAASADTGGALVVAYTGTWAVRATCIVAGNPASPAPPRAHPGDMSPHLSHLRRIRVFTAV